MVCTNPGAFSELCHICSISRHMHCSGNKVEILCIKKHRELKGRYGQINFNSIVQLRETYYVKAWAGFRGGVGEKLHSVQGEKHQRPALERRLLKEI